MKNSVSSSKGGGGTPPGGEGENSYNHILRGGYNNRKKLKIRRGRVGERRGRGRKKKIAAKYGEGKKGGRIGEVFSSALLFIMLKTGTWTHEKRNVKVEGPVVKGSAGPHRRS